MNLNPERKSHETPLLTPRHRSPRIGKRIRSSRRRRPEFFWARGLSGEYPFQVNPRTWIRLVAKIPKAFKKEVGEPWPEQRLLAEPRRPLQFAWTKNFSRNYCVEAAEEVLTSTNSSINTGFGIKDKRSVKRTEQISSTERTSCD